ncbi:MAG: hypothetical protein HYZ71_07675 [Deltaproteobacteria bacterium]|nr:hypothetical protein [Deltaproteobacteria bacterium]
MMWRIKQMFNQAIPWVIVIALAWGGYSMHRRGAFRHGIPTLGQALSYLPHFGSRFASYSPRRGRYAYAPAHRHGVRPRGRHHGRRHRRHR